MAKLYHISRSGGGYDTYDSAVVSADSPEEATLIHPSGNNKKWSVHKKGWSDDFTWGSWVDPTKVTAVEIGVAADGIKPGTVICASFNAG